MADTRGDERQRFLDRCFEALKHVTTLSTAAALLILAIYREAPFREHLLALPLILMGLCVVLSVFGMLTISLGSHTPPNQPALSDTTEDAIVRWTTIVAGGVFMASVITFGLAILAVPFWYQLGTSLALLVLLVGAILFVRRRRRVSDAVGVEDNVDVRTRR